MIEKNRMAKLYDRLKTVGITSSYARAVALPAGWKDNEAENPAVYSQALGLLARNLNLDLRSLQDEKAPVAWKDCGPTRFLKNSNVTDGDLIVARCLAARAAQVASYATSCAEIALPESAQEIRTAILQEASCVSFRALLEYCWKVGIPVLHVAKFPERTTKPTALAAMFDGRPAIVLCGRRKYASWMLFWLAHELGHIVRKHLDSNGLYVDEQIDRKSNEKHEVEANAFAVELLTGKPDIMYRAPFTLSAQVLAESARLVGKRDSIDPGVIALNYAWNEGRFDIGNKALGLLEEDKDPVEIIRAEMKARLCWSELSRENREFLRHITETE